MDQEIAVTAGAKGCFFGDIPVAGNQSLYNGPSRADSIAEAGRGTGRERILIVII
jgi:hypothetical protein